MAAYLRVVVTTRCPLRCAFCHAEGDPAGDTHAGGLPAELLVPLVRAGLRNGVRKCKLLGGDPLVRRDLPALVASLRAADPRLDLSLITAGAGDPGRLDACFEAGLSRANLSIHGWSAEAFARRGGTPALRARRDACLDRLLAWGRPLKLNYVYGGPADRQDLGALLDWAAGRPLVVNVLDDLNRSDLGSAAVFDVVTHLRGTPRETWDEPDPWSLPTRHLRWGDGLEVEVKDRRLGEVAPWRACAACPKRARCGEGIHAIRLTHDGVLRTCMDRPDLGLPLLPVLERGGEAAVAAAWRCFVAGATVDPYAREAA